MEDLKQTIGCHLSGSFEIVPVDGNFHISFHPFMDSFFQLRSKNATLFEQLNLSYSIKTLKFGNFHETLRDNDVKEMLRNDFDLQEQLFDNHIDHSMNDYDHFIAGFWLELIPYTLVDHRKGVTYHSLQHSFNRKIKKVQPDEYTTYVPILDFNYKFSSLSARYEIDKRSRFNFYAEFFSISGAFLTCISLVNGYIARWAN